MANPLINSGDAVLVVYRIDRDRQLVFDFFQEFCEDEEQ